MYKATASCKDIARTPVTNWEPQCVTLAGYCYAVRHGMKVQLVTPYRVSHLQRYGCTVRGNVTVCTRLKRLHWTLESVFAAHRWNQEMGLHLSSNLAILYVCELMISLGTRVIRWKLQWRRYGLSVVGRPWLWCPTAITRLQRPLAGDKVTWVWNLILLLMLRMRGSHTHSPTSRPCA
jgi:hypothetical protein